MKKRTLVIGDIHGAFKALVQVLDRADLQPADRLIFLGDYVDGWSEAKDVVDYLIRLSETQQCIFIRGNHDTWCEEWLRTGIAEERWLKHGGEATRQSYLHCAPDYSQKHLSFFQTMVNYFEDENNDLFIHAGYSSMHGPSHETYQSNFSWDRTLWEVALTMDKRIAKDSKLYPQRLKLYKEIYIGHTPTINYDVNEPMNAINIWNIDTGAGFYGKLTVLDVETKEYWQSDVVQSLYPNEKGRNK